MDISAYSESIHWWHEHDGKGRGHELRNQESYGKQVYLSEFVHGDTQDRTAHH